ncbi:MAG: CDP-diacylglycerol--serine O-phosphatidyltransferase [Endomicrobium sp.]|nr:CDP-diacylglycerol--serine O-phosphatidyltransferase [Endomicrobium sp.]
MEIKMSGGLKRGIYIIPSLFTCGNMTFGYLSIISSINGTFTKAAWFLMLAIAFDVMDGRIARITKTTSEFGVQFDSLSDLISFGLAPSVMMYQLVLNTMDKVGLAIAVLFILCSAFRLARFNVKAKNNGVVRRNSFIGLPTPASAGVLVSFVLSYELFAADPGQSLTFKTIPILMKNMPVFFKTMPIAMLFLSLLMVSNIPYISFKKIDFSKPKAFRFLILMIVVIWLMITFPQNIIFILFTLYSISGLFNYVMKYWRIYIKGRNDGN